MASEVDICNLALSHIGDAAQVSNIDPPDQSMQAGLCARFYPIARDALQEIHTWGFCTVRAPLALTSLTSNEWQYVYQGPGGVLNYLTVIDSDAVDDFSQAIPIYGTLPMASTGGPGLYTPQPFVVESDGNGGDLIYTNQENAALHYTQSVSNTNAFSPLFVDTLALWLASYLAGPIIKGAEGRQTAMALRQEAKAALTNAAESDANQRRTQIAMSTSWIANR